jgi:hypothetical protein
MRCASACRAMRSATSKASRGAAHPCRREVLGGDDDDDASGRQVLTRPADEHRDRRGRHDLVDDGAEQSFARVRVALPAHHQAGAGPFGERVQHAAAGGRVDAHDRLDLRAGRERDPLRGVGEASGARAAPPACEPSGSTLMATTAPESGAATCAATRTSGPTVCGLETGHDDPRAERLLGAFRLGHERRLRSPTAPAISADPRMTRMIALTTARSDEPEVLRDDDRGERTGGLPDGQREHQVALRRDRPQREPGELRARTS